MKKTMERRALGCAKHDKKKKKGKNRSRGTDTEMSVTKGQEKGEATPGTSPVRDGVSKLCH